MYGITYLNANYYFTIYCYKKKKKENIKTIILFFLKKKYLKIHTI